METKEEAKSELVTLDDAGMKGIFDGSGMDSMLAQIADKVRATPLDISTPSGRSEVASVAYKVARTKTTIDAAGKKLVEGIKAEAKIIDEERKKARDFLDALKDEVRLPLTNFENAEKERVSQLEGRIERIKGLAVDVPQGSEAAQSRLSQLEVLSELGTFQEFEAVAAKAIKAAKTTLTELLERSIKAEADAAELERLRAEAAERDRIAREEEIAKRAAETARVEAEAKAAKEKADAERLHEEAIRAEREAAAKREAKIRQEAEDAARAEKAKADAEAAAAAKREANEKHRKAVIGKAIQALQASGVDQSGAEICVSAIAAGRIPGITIQF